MPLSIADCERYLGLPWRRAATGPDSYDCWGLVKECLTRDGADCNVTIDYNFPGGISREFEQGILNPRWRRLDAPVDGGIVYCMQSGIPAHVGYVVEGMVLHAMGDERNPGTVQISPLAALHRLYHELRFYEWLAL